VLVASLTMELPWHRGHQGHAASAIFQGIRGNASEENMMQRSSSPTGAVPFAFSEAGSTIARVWSRFDTNGSDPDS